MRDLLFTWPPAISIGLFSAQLGPIEPLSMERTTITALMMTALIFVWRHFQARDQKNQEDREKKEQDWRDSMVAQAAEDKEERNQLLERLNATNEKQLERAEEYQRQLMQIQRDSIKAQEDSNRSVKELIRKGHCPKTILPE